MIALGVSYGFDEAIEHKGSAPPLPACVRELERLRGASAMATGTCFAQDCTRSPLGTTMEIAARNPCWPPAWHDLPGMGGISSVGQWVGRSIDRLSP